VVAIDMEESSPIWNVDIEKAYHGVIPALHDL